jgi:predicted outer membrane protein
MSKKTTPANSESSALIEAFLVANPLPTTAQWRELTLAHPEQAVQISDAAFILSSDATDGDATDAALDTDLFNSTRSAMLNAMSANTGPVEAAKACLKQCKGPAARDFARQIGLGERVDLFNQMVSGEVSAPYVLVKRLADRLQVRLAAIAEVFAMNFQNQPLQAFKADGKPVAHRKSVSWEQAVKAAGVTGEEAARLLRLEKEMD